METNIFWEFFLDTGAPEAYLLYLREQNRAGRAPEND